MANLYYREDLSPDEFRVGATVEIIGDEAHHAVRVARLREGEEILVGDAKGVIARGDVVTVSRSSFNVRIDDTRSDPPPTRPIALVQALAKGDRDERAVEQATEFGIDLIVPWQAARSVSRWDSADKADKGRAKWQRIAREASKQSLRPRVPAVLPVAAGVGNLCSFATAGAQVLILDPGADRSLSEYAGTELAAYMASPLPDSVAPGDPVAGVLLVVGPEGGIDANESAALREAGAVALRLGDTVLRTSSAGPAALAVLHAVLGRW